jgi:hypothetical protein
LPGFSFADSCGLWAGLALEVEFAIVQMPPFVGPTPNTSGPVDVGDTAVSVTATLPAVATEDVNMSEPFGASVPLKVSVEVLVEDVVGVPNRSLSGLLHADVTSTAAEITSVRASRETVMFGLIGPSAQAD